MLCERCNKKKATVFYRENINGHIKALRLCGDCAQILEQAGELEDISAAVAGFLSPFFLSDEDTYSLPFHQIPQESPQSGTRPIRKCPTCGASWSDIATAGKVGCPTCYTIYADELASTIRASHGKAEHTGRVSAGYRARLEKTERLAGLKKQLKEAVAGEKYEMAAGLRDQIRALEAEL